jgi:hypothetical protein
MQVAWGYVGDACGAELDACADADEMNPHLIERLEARHGATRVADRTALLGVDDKHIDRMAARGQLPSCRLGGAVCFDPQEVGSGYDPNIWS